MCWTTLYTRRRQTVQHILCCVFYFVCLHLVYGGVQHILCRVFYFVCLRLVYGGVQHILCRVFYFVCLHLVYTICVEQHYIQDEDKQNKKHDTICVGHHYTQDEDKQNKKHDTICVGHHLFVCLRVVSCVWWYLAHIVLCICLFVFLLYLVYGDI
jgi:hypothetical protein